MIGLILTILGIISLALVVIFLYKAIYTLSDNEYEYAFLGILFVIPTVILLVFGIFLLLGISLESDGSFFYFPIFYPMY